MTTGAHALTVLVPTASSSLEEDLRATSGMASASAVWSVFSFYLCGGFFVVVDVCFVLFAHPTGPWEVPPSTLS